MNTMTFPQAVSRGVILQAIRSMSEEQMLTAVNAIEAKFGRAPHLEQLRQAAMQSVMGGTN